jgi:hypothetical protein
MPESVGQIESYTELKKAIADWLDRDDLTAVIPLFIQLAEADMNQKIRHHKMVVRSQAVGYRDDPQIQLPVNWLKARKIKINSLYNLVYQSMDVIEMLRTRTDGGVPDYPVYYTFYDQHLTIWPTLDEDWIVDLDYYQKIPPLKDALDNTNWLLDDSPGIYLYGSLVQSAPYLKDDERIMLWDKMYTEGLTTLQGGSDDAMTSGSRLTRTPTVSLG